jgi:hypothetical protein
LARIKERIKRQQEKASPRGRFFEGFFLRGNEWVVVQDCMRCAEYCFSFAVPYHHSAICAKNILTK